MVSSKKRAHQKAEIYLKLFYEERIHDLEVAECQAKGIKGKGKMLAVRNKIARDQWAKADEETRARVEAEHLAEIEARVKVEVDKELPIIRTPQQYLE